MVKERNRTCRECRGTGRVMHMVVWPLADWVACDRCAGSGEETVYEMTEAEFLAWCREQTKESDG